MAILVTGGAGFIGSHLCEELVVRREEVICIDNFDNYYNPKIKEKNTEQLRKRPNFKLYREDITNKEAIEKIFRENKISKVVHLAAKAGVRASLENPVEYAKVNVVGTTNLLEASRKYCKNFIFCSSSSVYGENKKIPFSEEDELNSIISPYAATKRAAEIICQMYHKQYGMNIFCLRLFTVYGPRNRPDMAVYKFTDKISRGEPIEMFGDGTTERDYTYVADIVNGILLAMKKTNGFEIINLGNSKPVMLKELIKIIEEATGKKAEIIQKPLPKGDVEKTFADITKAKQLLGWQPTITIQEGIPKTVEWYKHGKVN